MSDSDSETVDASEWLVGEVRARVTPDDPWTSTTQILQEAQKTSTPISKPRANAEIKKGVEEHDLLSWHGLLTVVDPEILRAITREEANAKWTRQTLVAECNKLLQTVTQ